MRLSDRGTPRGANALAIARAELAAGGVRVTDLSSSNPTRHGLLHPGIMSVIARHARKSARYEPLPRGPRQARAALAARYGGDADDYYLASSTSQLYAWLISLFADPADEIAVPCPGYPLIGPIAQLEGAGTVDYRFHYAHHHGWILDPESLAAALDRPSVRAAVVINPGNPTGAYVDAAYEHLIESCASRALPLIADEVFGPFALDHGAGGAAAGTAERQGAGMPGSVPVPSFAGEDRCVTVTLGGLSKLLCAPQLKIAWARISGPSAECDRLRDALDAIADMFLPTSQPVADALPELLDLSDESVTATVARLRENLHAVRSLFAAGPYRVRQCGGGWMVLLDVPPVAGANDLVVHLLEKAHMFAHPGWFYDLAEEGALAISLLPENGEFVCHLRVLRGVLDAWVARG